MCERPHIKRRLRLALHEKWFLQLTDSSLRSLRISVISALDISRDYGYAEITEIRRDRREDFKSPTGTTFRAMPLRLVRGEVLDRTQFRYASVSALMIA
jgi:hypothetical protein